MVPLVRLRSVVCLLGRFPALAGVDLDVAGGEIVLLTGPNGAGKSTLLRVLAGLLAVHRGEVEVLGQDLTVDRRAHRRGLALVGHDTSCYDDLTTRENLRFAAKASGRDGATADSALARLGLTRQADVTHGRLSAGQRRRLTLAAALARDPRLLLLDEPHAGLDAEGRVLLDEIVAAAPAEGRTVVLASHELDLTRPLATREVVVVAGRASGLVAPVVADPAAVASDPSAIVTGPAT
ncbi:MAG: heme ABC exporter ATP-binding protein CcmA [Acidimicrobiia bacterium]